MGLFDFFKSKKKKGEILFYPGCLTKYVLKPETENYIKILNKLGVDFIRLPEDLCCGSPVLNAGYEVEARKLARKNLKMFKEKNIRKIITNCPACFKTLGKDYREMMPDWDIEVEHITKTILDYLERKRINYAQRQRVTYHDPCHLGRHSEIYDAPREILERLGYEVVEMKNNRENSLCCGGGAGLRTNNPDLASKIAKERIKQAEELHVSKIITTCPLCFVHMKENSNVKIEEFSFAVADALGLRPEETKEIEGEVKEACS